MYKNTINKWIVFAFNRTDNVPLTGDAINITANLRLDGGIANPVDDTNPTELEDGYYVFDITAAESNADNILISPVSVTGDIQVIGCPAAQSTTNPVLASIYKNIALSNFTFNMVLASDHYTAAPGLIVAAKISKDGGAFASCANAVIEIGIGFYKIDLTQTEMNADILALNFGEVTADDRNFIIKTDS